MLSSQMLRAHTHTRPSIQMGLLKCRKKRLIVPAVLHVERHRAAWRTTPNVRVHSVLGPKHQTEGSTPNYDALHAHRVPHCVHTHTTALKISPQHILQTLHWHEMEWYTWASVAQRREVRMLHQVRNFERHHKHSKLLFQNIAHTYTRNARKLQRTMICQWWCSPA